jgi:Conserved protein/domain typically associated with flavoprotein oxygenases, DIM6/NTAB family
MDPQAKKHVLRMLTYGLYVLTAADEGDVAAGTATWLSQASFEPPLVMVAVRADSNLHRLIERGGQFAVNIVAEGQKELAAAFFRTSEVTATTINGYPYERGPETGAPLLLDTPDWFEARVTDAVKRGDHTVFVAQVISAGVRDAEARPLLLQDTGWSYGG